MSAKATRHIWLFIKSHLHELLAALLICYLAFSASPPAAIPTSSPNVGLTSVQGTTRYKHGLPARLSITKLKVEAPILSMGLTASGDMDAPEKLDEVGWYRHGPRPGEPGSAVLAGHLGVGGPGIFVDLNKLVAGDQISVIDDQGKTTFFQVRETRLYDQAARPREVFMSPEGVHLNLITCAGVWNRKADSYTQRLVVFADKE